MFCRHLIHFGTAWGINFRPYYILILIEIFLEFGIKETSGKTQTIVLETSSTFLYGLEYLDGHFKPYYILILIKIVLEFGIKGTSGKIHTIVLGTISDILIISNLLYGDYNTLEVNFENFAALYIS